MTDLTIADHRATFAAHPLEGSSRFSLLGLLAELKGITLAPNVDPATDERERLTSQLNEVFGDVHDDATEFVVGQRLTFERAEPFAVSEIRGAMSLMEAARQRELANEILGERVVDALFGDGPVRVTMTSGDKGTVTR